MLQQDPEKRISAAKALQHPYMLKKIARRKTQDAIKVNSSEGTEIRGKNKSVYDKS